MKIINSLNNILSKIESLLLIIILFTMIFLAFLQVVLRNFISSSISGADVFLRHLVLWVGFIGASLATKENRHINIDALSRLLSQTSKRIAAVVINLFSATVCFFLMRAAITFIKSEKEAGSVLLANIPTWIFQIIIAIGFGLMTLRFLLHALENLLPQKPSAAKEEA